MKTKKILAVLLAVLMTLTLGATALAEDEPADDGWVYIHKNLAGIQVGDYYLEKDIFYSYATEEIAKYVLPEALASYEETYGTAPTEDQAEQIKDDIKRQMRDEFVTLTRFQAIIC